MPNRLTAALAALQIGKTADALIGDYAIGHRIHVAGDHRDISAATTRAAIVSDPDETMNCTPPAINDCTPWVPP